MRDAEWVAGVQDCFWQEAETLLYHHTNPWELDEALTAAAFEMGPCEAQDLLGLEQVLTRAPNRQGPVLKRMVAEGRMGKIGGVGFYRYPGGGGAVIDPLIEDLILEEAWFGKVARSELSDADLVKRMMQALVPMGRAMIQSGRGSEDASRLLSRAVYLPKDQHFFL